MPVGRRRRAAWGGTTPGAIRGYPGEGLGVGSWTEVLQDTYRDLLFLAGIG